MPIPTSWRRTSSSKALAAYDEAAATLKNAEARLGEVTTAAAEARARRKSAEAQLLERRERVQKLQRQLTALESQVREIVGRAPDASKLKATAEAGQQLMADIAEIEQQTVAAEAAVQAAAQDATAKSELAAEVGLAAGQLRTEVETLAKLLKPTGDSGLPPVLDHIKVASGYELALAAALGDDLDAPAAAGAPVHWSLNAAPVPDPELLAGVEPLAARVAAPPELARRLMQIGVVRRADGARLQRQLKPGQRLVSVEGDLWRWDGFVAAAQGAIAAASRLQERSRLGILAGQEDVQRRAAETARGQSEEAAGRLRGAQGEERRLRQLWRDCQGRLAQTRETLTAMERQARETEAKLAGVADAKERTQENLARSPRPAFRNRGHRAGPRRHGDAGSRSRCRPESGHRAQNCASARPRPSSSRSSGSIAPARNGKRPSPPNASAGKRARPARSSRSPRSSSASPRPVRRSSAWPVCPRWWSSSARSS